MCCVQCTGSCEVLARGGACTRSTARVPTGTAGCRDNPLQTPRPRQAPHFHTRVTGRGRGTQALPRQPAAPPPPERQFDASSLLWAKALCLPDVLQGQLLMPFINYLRRGLPLFLTKQPQQQRSQLRLPGPQVPTGEGQDRAGPGPAQEGRGQAAGARAWAGPGRPLGFSVSPSLPSALCPRLLMAFEGRGPWTQREEVEALGGDPPTLLSTWGAPLTPTY